jgi:hypothetical protein
VSHSDFLRSGGVMARILLGGKSATTGHEDSILFQLALWIHEI